ncbi:MAG: CheR family methyltransferase, partial [Cyanobacteria bacterium P01_F01_bin.4]
LSVPCSTGQEPYSIAIALLEAGLTPNQFEIQAIDISHQALTLAKRARYDSYSFRTPYPYNQQRYFYPHRGNQQLDASIQKLVQFRQGNVIDRLLQDPPSPYNIIFCRNLLIYLTPTARHQTMARLEQWLSPTGLLFLGHAETYHVDKKKFTPVQYPLTFAFQRQTTPTTQSPQQNFCKSSPTQTRDPSRFTNTQPDPTAPTLKQQAQYQWRQYQWIHKPWVKKQYQQSSISQSVAAVSPRGAGETPTRREISRSTRSPAPRILPRPRLSSPSPPSLSRQSSLTTARAFADRGNFKIAASLCTAYLEQNPASADAYLLRGEIYQAEGQPVAAETCFQKAIYLEPDCYEALLHLCLIKEQQGNRAGASVIRDRIQRLSERASKISEQSK